MNRELRKKLEKVIQLLEAYATQRFINVGVVADTDVDINSHTERVELTVRLVIKDNNMNFSERIDISMKAMRNYKPETILKDLTKKKGWKSV